MSSLNASIFGVIAALAVGGTDYAIAMKKHQGTHYSLRDHIEFRFNAAMSGSKLAQALPRAPVGWDMRDGSTKDSFLVMDLPIDSARLGMMEAVESKMLADSPGLQMENRLYQKGDTSIYYDITFLPSTAKSDRAADVMAQMFSSLDRADAAPLNPDDGDFAVRKISTPEMGRAALYFGQIDGQIFISALSNATEAETLALMAGVDKGALRLLVLNDPTIGQAPIAAAEPDKPAACVQKGAAKFCSSTN